MAGLLAIGMVAWGHPVAAAVYAALAIINWAVSSPKEK